MITLVEFLADVPIPQNGTQTSRRFYSSQGWSFELSPEGIRVTREEPQVNALIRGVPAVIHEEPRRLPTVTSHAPETSSAIEPPKKNENNKKGAKKS